jgi:hypothetical protein
LQQRYSSHYPRELKIVKKPKPYSLAEWQKNSLQPQILKHSTHFSAKERLRVITGVLSQVSDFENVPATL